MAPKSYLYRLDDIRAIKQLLPEYVLNRIDFRCNYELEIEYEKGEIINCYTKNLNTKMKTDKKFSLNQHLSNDNYSYWSSNSSSNSMHEYIQFPLVKSNIHMKVLYKILSIFEIPQYKLVDGKFITYSDIDDNYQGDYYYGTSDSDSDSDD